MKRLVIALLLSGVGCLSTVEDRWCGPQLPCSPGFFCTSTFHCIRSASVDGGTGGGSAGGDGGAIGGGGGAVGGGGGFVGGGAGGGPTCNAVNCAGGCCLGNNCVTPMQQGHEVCGFFGDVCGRCGFDEGCVGGKCQPVIVFDGGTTNARVGDPCFDDFNCSNDGLSFCIPEESGFPEGYCSRMCDTELCPSNAACVEAQTTGGEVVNICLLACQAVAQCRMGYQCDLWAGQRVCRP